MASSILLVVCIVLLGSSAIHGSKARKVPQVSKDWVGWEATGRDTRYNHFLGHIQYHLVPNFTETGYAMVDMPAHIYTELQTVLQDALTAPLPADTPVNILENADGKASTADYIARQGLYDRILRELHPAHEAWSGVSLAPTNAFGLRVYREGSVLHMHVDRVETHIISSILHVGRDVDEPWPLIIMNNTGHMHEVDLIPGKMLFYESARLLHGRPRPMKGRYYTSLFIHYRPVDWTLTHAMVDTYLPPNWANNTGPAWTPAPADTHHDDHDHVEF